MLTLDTAMQGRWGQHLVVERTRALTASALADQIANNDSILVADNGVDVTDANAQLGQLLSWQELQTRLGCCQGRLTFEVSNNYPDLRGVYMMLPDPTAPWENRKVKTFIVGFPNSNAIPEFSIQHYVEDRRPILGDPYAQFETYKRFTHVTRGWRNVLVILLRRGLITVDGVKNNFPTCWRQSQRWHESIR